MTWQIAVALVFLGLAIVGGFAICIATSVNAYARRLTEGPPKDRRRGFEVVNPVAGGEPPAAREEEVKR